MRFVFATAFAVLFNNAQGDNCQAYCNDLADCRDDPDEQGSYCKTWQEPHVCFGLYWGENEQTSMCYAPHSSGPCPEYRPVRCSAAADKFCQELCSITAGCEGDHHVHGSYCKAWEDPHVCFGLYYTDASRTSTCFQPGWLSCPQEFPVECVEV